MNKKKPHPLFKVLLQRIARIVEKRAENIWSKCVTQCLDSPKVHVSLLFQSA